MYPARFTPAPLALTVVIAVALTGGLAPRANAQSGAAASTIELPPVTVTATQDTGLSYLTKEETAGALGKRLVLDTPFSMTVVDSEEITERGAKSIGQIFFRDAAVYTPTSSFTTDWWGTQIRGMPVRNNYIDDIPILLYWGGDFPTEIVESVTALKGLTGFMYGFGEPGGALSYQLKRPKAEDETSVIMGYRNPNLFSVHVDSSRKFEDDLAVRVNVATEQGTVYNESKIDRTVASIAFDKKIGTSVNRFTTLAYEDNRIEDEPFQFYFNSYTDKKLPSATYDYDNFNIEGSFYHTRTSFASTGLQWQINDAWNLKYQLGFSRKDHESHKAFADLLNRQGDYSGSMYNFAGQLDNVFTQAMLQGIVQAGGMKHEIVAGLGWQQSTEAYSHFQDGAEAGVYSGNLYREQTFQPTATPDFHVKPVTYDTRQQSAFLSDTVHFNEHWQAIVGLRYTEYRLKDLDSIPAEDSAYDAHRTSPTLALIYKPNAATSFYGSYIEALEPGSRVGENAPPYANVGELLEATVSKQYEIGLKHTSGKADYTAALFRVERANQMDEDRGGLRYLTQEGLVIYQGIEVSGAYQVSNNLTLGAAAVYLDAAISKVSADNAAIEGNDPLYAPPWQIVAYAEYRVPEVMGLKLQGDARYFDSAYTSDENTLSIPGWTIFNAGFTYDFRAQNHDLTLIGNIYNVFDTKYWAGGGYSSGNMGEARNFSLALRAQF